ncbi:MAG: LLM class flavin-dependent oxidoreductase [Dehalococcoidia bacterium]|jgi:alkanesulfonate monooxygenase SsuD/methylene tetrahydromethanopterin reductase-like flavin-dependent oxidoreductase (luciferase family)|nr:LLM class flavin-dependent oxidoreductase [Dehalococcoidia bacterium]
MEYGVHLPLISFSGESRTLEDLRVYTSDARDLGYSYLCANDHLLFSRPWLDGPTALSAVLDVSGEMRLATTIALPVLRGPVATAKALGAIDLLSGGRMTVGVGPGSSEADYRVAGLDFSERWKRFDESIAVLRAMWRGQSFDGTFYPIGDASLLPRPAQKDGPPIWVASWGSEAGLRRTARLGDGWLASGYNTTPEIFPQALAYLGEQLASRGKDPGTFPNGIATLWMSVTEDRAEATRVIEDVVSKMLNRPADQIAGLLPVGSAEECAVLMSRYAAVGAERVFVWPVADDREQIERFMERVVPLVTDNS